MQSESRMRRDSTGTIVQNLRSVSRFSELRQGTANSTFHQSRCSAELVLRATVSSSGLICNQQTPVVNSLVCGFDPPEVITISLGGLPCDRDIFCSDHHPRAHLCRSFLLIPKKLCRDEHAIWRLALPKPRPVYPIGLQ